MRTLVLCAAVALCGAIRSKERESDVNKDDFVLINPIFGTVEESQAKKKGKNKKSKSQNRKTPKQFNGRDVLRMEMDRVSEPAAIVVPVPQGGQTSNPVTTKTTARPTKPKDATIEHMLSLSDRQLEDYFDREPALREK